VTDTILLTVPTGTRGSGVVALVLGGLGARLELPVDRIDELALAVTTIAGSARGATLDLAFQVSADRLTLRIGPLEPGTTSDGARRRVIEALVDAVDTVRVDDDEWFDLGLELASSGAMAR